MKNLFSRKIEIGLVRKNSGFTLIELLVVISIISVLAAFLMANFINIRQRGRDAQRKSDLKQIQSALELYRSDHGKYPGFADDNHAGWGTISNENNPALDPYFSNIPSDPSSVNDSCPTYVYTIDSNFSEYTIFAMLENSNDLNATQEKPTPNLGNLSGTNTGDVTFRPGQSPCTSTDYNYWVINP